MTLTIFVNCRRGTRQIRACISIISRGEYDKEDYVKYLKGIRSLTDHIFGKKFTPEIAAEKACSVMCLAASALTQTDYPKIADAAGVVDKLVVGVLAAPAIFILERQI